MNLVNDGSPDRCGEIIRRYEEKWPFTGLYGRNSGLGAARNTGIATRRGNTLPSSFDDYVEPDFIRALVRAARSKSADVAVCEFYFTFQTGWIYLSRC